MWREAIESEIDRVMQSAASCRCSTTPSTFDHQKVILYGAGIDGIKVLESLVQTSADVAFFFDIRAQELGTDLHGVPVKIPTEPVIPDEEKETIPVIITVKPMASRYAAIEKTLNENGYRNIYRAPEIFEFYSFSQADIDDQDSIRRSLIQTAKRLQDAESFSIYKEFLSSHATKKYDTFAAPSDHIKYFDIDFESRLNFTRFIDCGAFTGDTLRDLRRIKGRVEKVALFEADTKTFMELTAGIHGEQNAYAAQLTAFPCGVWSDTVKLYANTGMGLNSHLSPTGTDCIQCVAIDQVLAGFCPTCIKMDVEGAEYQALCGARETITQYRPDLIISLYHNLQDMWELPALLREWDLGYTFYIRAYGHGGNATMLYAMTGSSQ